MDSADLYAGTFVLGHLAIRITIYEYNLAIRINIYEYN